MDAALPNTIDRTRLLPRSGIGVDGAWLVIAPPGNPIIRLDARLLDRVELIGRSPTAPLVASGLATAGVAAAALSVVPGGLLACAGLAYLAHERFSEARRRSRSRDLLLALGDLEVALLVGTDVVFLRGDYLQVGQVAFRVSEVREYALRGANLPLTGGRLLQAAMGLLVVAAEERATGGEDVALLSKRIADYEAWSGHTAGR